MRLASGLSFLRETPAQRVEKGERLVAVPLVDEAAALNANGGEFERLVSVALDLGERGADAREVGGDVLALLELTLAEANLHNAHTQAPQRVANDSAHCSGREVIGGGPGAKVSPAVYDARQATRH